MSQHKERAHSKFSASGAERRNRCAYSVEAEEKAPPSVDTPWSKEGTLAHEVKEAMQLGLPIPDTFDVTDEMLRHCEKSVEKIKAIHRASGGTHLVEKRVYAEFIHPEMFGTCDDIIAGDDRILHILDFKYGKGHIVDPYENHQLIQYALSVAESYAWAGNGWDEHFDTVKLWIIQPRAGKNWFKSWEVPMHELEKEWQDYFKRGVARALRGNQEPNPGSWCHWCRAKNTCPAKTDRRAEKISNAFESNPLPKEENGRTKESEKGYPKGFWPKEGQTKSRKENIEDRIKKAFKVFDKEKEKRGSRRAIASY